MTKARTLANFISDGSTLADGAISVSEVSGAAPLASPTFTGTLNISSSENNVALLDSSHATSTQMFLRNTNTGTGLYTVLGFAPANSVSGATITTYAEEDFSEAANRTARLEIDTRDNGNWFNRLTMGRVEAVFNDDSDATDFRVESDTNAHALFVDAGNSRIGFFNSAPSAPLHLIAGTPSTFSDAFQIGDGTYTNIAMYSGAADGEIRIGAAGALRGRYAAQYAGTRSVHDFALGTNNNERIGMKGDGSSVVINEAGANTDFRVESDGNSHMLFVDAGDNAVGVNWGSPTEMFSVKDGNMFLYSTSSYGTAPAQLKFQHNVAAGSNPSSGYVSTVHSSQNAYSGNLLLGGRGYYSGSYTDVPVLTVSAYKRVGINLDVSAGYADPGEALHVRTNGSEDPYVLVDGSSSNRDSGYKINAGGGVDMAIRSDFAGNMFFGPNGDIKVDTSNNTVINEAGENRDFRVEGDSNTHMLFVDASENRVKIGSTSGTAVFNVQTSLGGTDPRFADFRQLTSGQDAQVMVATSANSSGDPYVKFDAGGSNMICGLHWSGTTNNKLMLGQADRPSDTIKGIRIDGNGNIGMSATDYFGGLSTSDDGKTGQYFMPNGGFFIARDNNSTGAETIIINNIHSEGASLGLFQYRTRNSVEGSLNGTSSGLAISNVSDYRKKENVADATGCLDKINGLRPVTYTHRSEYDSDTTTVHTGFIAHEVSDHLPSIVNGTKDAVDEDGNVVLQSLAYADHEMIANLVGAIKELKARIVALENA